MCARSMHRVVAALGGAFVRDDGHEVEFDFDTEGALQAKLDAGQTADLLILSKAMVDKLARAGAVLSGSQTDVASTFIAICVREDAVLPDIATLEGFKRTLREAKSVAM